jgi:hypothetical protein
MYSLEYAADLINKLGGATSFLRMSPTMIRRFLMEQMACVDVFGEEALLISRSDVILVWLMALVEWIASWFTIDAPLILEPHATWWEEPYSKSGGIQRRPSRR